MSMTVKTAIGGITELELLKTALEAMGLALETGRTRKVRGEAVLASVQVDGRVVGFARNRAGDLEMVGDGDWRIMRDTGFQHRLRQQYAVAAVKRKARQMHYHVASVETTNTGDVRILCRAWGG